MGERQLKGFLKLWLWGLMTKYQVNNSYHHCFLPPYPRKVPQCLSETIFVLTKFILALITLSQGGSHKDVDGNGGHSSCVICVFDCGTVCFIVDVVVVGCGVEGASSGSYDSRSDEVGGRHYSGHLPRDNVVVVIVAISAVTNTTFKTNTHISINNITPHTPFFKKQHQGI